MQFSFHQKVLFKHCDPAGIVFYPRYFEMINDCVEAFFCEIGSPFETLHKTATVPTVEISTTFHAPSRHGDHLDIRLSTTHIGNSSSTLLVEASSQSKARFTANLTLVYVNDQGLPQRWPDPIRNSLTLYSRSEE